MKRNKVFIAALSGLLLLQAPILYADSGTCRVLHPFKVFGKKTAALSCEAFRATGEFFTDVSRALGKASAKAFRAQGRFWKKFGNYFTDYEDPYAHMRPHYP